MPVDDSRGDAVLTPDVDIENGEPTYEVRSPSISVTTQKIGRFITSRRRSSNFSIPSIHPQQISLNKCLAREILPRYDNYRQSIGMAKPAKMRPTLEDLLNNIPEKTTDEDDEEEQAAKAGKVIKLGWMDGVLMKCLLNIWGVMLYLRLTWVIGQAGMVEGLFIIGIANLVTIITAISMSAVCTNGVIKAGGIYYMISRSLGPEFGGAIGLMFFLANSIAVSMYLIGFCESLLDCMKQYGGIMGITSVKLDDIRIIGCSGLGAILVLALVGMDWITRVQIGLLALLVVSQIDFIVGTFLEPSDELKAKGFIGYNGTLLMDNLWESYTFNEEQGEQHNFFSVFAVFFPAVTGIVAGANLSGDLKDPSDAIPKGTLWAIGITCISYLSYGVLSAGCSLRHASGIIEEVWFAEGRLNESLALEKNITRAYDDCSDRQCEYGLLNSQQMIEVMSAWGPMIYAGCFAATLSSAIGSLEGAPRVFQALSKDKLLPGLHFFAKGSGANNDPVRGYFLVSTIALICLLIGNLNVVSSLLSNFFVAAYGLINFCVFHVSLTKSPSWRPKFIYYNMWVSLAGCILCVLVMFLMDWKTALATYIIILLLCIAIKKNKPDCNWGSSTQSQSFLSALKSIHDLTKVEDHIKNYRPKIVVLSGDPSDRPCLVDFANMITTRLSFLECVNIVKENMEWNEMSAMRANGIEWMLNNRVKAFYSISRHSNFGKGARAALEMSGLGKMKPNMMLIGFKENWNTSPHEARDYYKVIQSAFEIRLAVGVLRISGGFDLSSQGSSSIFVVDPVKPQSAPQVSVDSGLEDMRDMRDLPPPPPYSQSPIVSFRMRQEEEHQQRRNLFGRPKVSAPKTKKKDKKKNQVLINSKGGEIRDMGLIRTMTQFRTEERMEGLIDVYWLYDDGGLTLLMPYILTTRQKYERCEMRVFVLASNNEDLNEETKNMAVLLAKFRINFNDIIMLTDVTKYPGKKIRDEFNEMIKPMVQPNGTKGGGYTSDGVPLITQYDVANNAEKTNFHLRLAEIVRENSKHAALVIMTLPMPKRDDSLPYGLYLAWLDITTKNMPPFLLTRGNQDSVLTFYS